MSPRILYPLCFLAVVGFAVLFGVAHTAIEAALHRRQARRAHPYYDQATHVRVIDRQETVR